MGAVEPGRSGHGRVGQPLAGFAAGAASVLTAHQGLLWALHAVGAAPWAAYATTPTLPWGVPAVASAAFWGGVWGAALARRLLRPPAGGPAFWARAAGLGAVLPTAAGAALLAAGWGRRPAAFPLGTALLAALLVNGAWGAATAGGLRALDRGRAPGRVGRR